MVRVNNPSASLKSKQCVYAYGYGPATHHKHRTSANRTFFWQAGEDKPATPTDTFDLSRIINTQYQYVSTIDASYLLQTPGPQGKFTYDFLRIASMRDKEAFFIFIIFLHSYDKMVTSKCCWCAFLNVTLHCKFSVLEWLSDAYFCYLIYWLLWSNPEVYKVLSLIYSSIVPFFILYIDQVKQQYTCTTRFDSPREFYWILIGWTGLNNSMHCSSHGVAFSWCLKGLNSTIHIHSCNCLWLVGCAILFLSVQVQENHQLFRTAMFNNWKGTLLQ
jgi:hypothetical protein